MEENLKKSVEKNFLLLENKKEKGKEKKKITHLFLGFLLDGSQRFGVREVVNSDGQEHVQQDICGISLVKVSVFNGSFVCLHLPSYIYFFREFVERKGYNYRI